MAKKFTTQNFQMALTALGYSFRLNLCNERVEVNGLPIFDSQFDKIHCQMRDLGYHNTQVIDEVIQATAFDCRYHPVKEYFGQLPGYDGKDYIQPMADTFTSSDGLFPLLIRKWMIGAVAKVLVNAQNPMLILDGPQDIGKSLFVEWLCSGLPGYFYAGPINPDDKDDKIRLASKWIWEVSEVGQTMRRADREALKNFLTLSEVTVRRPYGRHDWSGAAMASFIGTVNNEGGILDDPTGNRRFWVTHIEKIDWEEYKKLDANMLWSEAYAAYQTGETWKLTGNEKKQIEQNNEVYQVEDPIELIIKDLFNIDPRVGIDQGWWESTLELTQICQLGGIKMADRALQMALGATLMKLGCRKKRATDKAKTSGYEGLRNKNRP